MCLTGQMVGQDSVSDRTGGWSGQCDSTEPQGLCIGALLMLFSDM